MSEGGPFSSILKCDPYRVDLANLSDAILSQVEVRRDVFDRFQELPRQIEQRFDFEPMSALKEAKRADHYIEGSYEAGRRFFEPIREKIAALGLADLILNWEV